MDPAPSSSLPITAPISDAAPNNSGMNLTQAMHAYLAEQNQQQPAPQETAQEVSTEQPVAQDAPDQGSTDKKPADAPEAPKKGPWEKLGKKEEAKTEEITQGDEDYPDEAPKAQNAWTKIKQEVKDRRAASQQWEQEKAKWEDERNTWDAERKGWQDKASKWDDQKEADYQKMRDRYAVDYIKETDEYQRDAATPWNEGNSSLKDIADYTKLNFKDFQDALMEPNRLARKKAISELIKKSEVELGDTEILSLADEAFRAGEQIQKAVEAHERLTKDAGLKREQALNAEKASVMKTQEEAKQVRQKALTEVLDGMSAQLKDLVESGIYTPEDIKGAGEGFDMEQDPMDLAYGNASANLLPKAISKIRELQSQIAKMETERKERQSVKPTLKPSGSNVPRGTNGRPAPTLEAAMQAYRNERWGMQ